MGLQRFSNLSTPQTNPCVCWSTSHMRRSYITKILSYQLHSTIWFCQRVNLTKCICKPTIIIRWFVGLSPRMSYERVHTSGPWGDYVTNNCYYPTVLRLLKRFIMDSTDSNSRSTASSCFCISRLLLQWQQKSYFWTVVHNRSVF